MLTENQVLEKLCLLFNDKNLYVEFKKETGRSVNTLGYYRYVNTTITLFPSRHETDNDLMQTAIHELAHHIDRTQNGNRARPHTGPFKKILRSLENKAYGAGILKRVESPELNEVFLKAVEFGDSILKFLEEDQCTDKFDAVAKKLYNPSNAAIKHFAGMAKAYHEYKLEMKPDDF